MNKIKTPVLIYLFVCSFSALAVALFAVIQYHLILGDPFYTTNYIIPVLVGLIFGFLLSRIIIIRRKLKNERDLVYQKNNRIRSFTGTIVHDLKNPVSAIHGFSGILLEKGDTYEDKTKTFLNRGIWNGKQIISGQWVEKSATPFPGGHKINIPGENSGRNRYSYSWWIKPVFTSGKK